MALNVPTSDFVTSSLNGAINASVNSMTIGTGLSIPATNGALQIDYDSIIAVGTASGPETILYSAYNSGTGAVTGITRGQAGTTGVSHSNGASVQCGNSSVYFTALNALYDAWTPVTETWTRVSNTQFTIVGDYTGVLSVGDKLKVTDTTTKYFYITSISFGGGTTTVNITGGTDYVLAATPTAKWYSKASSPVGFPGEFATSVGYLRMERNVLIQRGSKSVTVNSGQEVGTGSLSFAIAYPDTNYTISIGPADSTDTATVNEGFTCYYNTKAAGSIAIGLRTRSGTVAANRTSLVPWRTEGKL